MLYLKADMIEFFHPFGDTRNYNIRVNNKFAGTLEPKEDGYWDWYPDLRPGYIPSWVLHAIANKLDEINQDWDSQIQKEIK